MSDDISRDSDEARHIMRFAALSNDNASPAEASADYSAQVSEPHQALADPRVGGRGNSSARTAALQRMQQTHGNRALQRFLQRQASGGDAAADDNIGDRIQSRAGAGSGLDTSVRGTLEQGLGADMSSVRVHTDSEADHLSRSVDAVAFTTGSDIFFRSGAYNPSSSDGMHLLAHEAAHTVQQSAGPVSGTPGPGGVSISDPSDSFEQAADHAASQVVSRMADPSAVAPAPATSGAAVQRAAAPDEEELPMQTKRASTGSFVQRAAAPQDEEEQLPMQTKREGLALQRAAAPEEEEQLPMQTMRAGMAVQRHAAAEENEQL